MIRIIAIALKEGEVEEVNYDDEKRDIGLML